MAPDQFKKWFAESRAIDEAGMPVIAYRALKANEGVPMVFGSAVAQSADVVGMAPAYLRIERPLLDSPDDPFIDFGQIADALGAEQAWRIARKFAGDVQATAAWAGGIGEFYGNDFARFLSAGDEDHLTHLCIEARALLDDAVEVDLLSAAGFDGAIVGGSGVHTGGSEFRIFSAEQALSAIEARWPYPAQIRPAEVLSSSNVMRETRAQSVTRVREAIAGIVGSAGVRLGEGLGRLVITTSAEINLDGHFLLRQGALASFASDAGFRAMLAEQRAAKKRTLEAIGEVLDCAVLRHKGGSDRWQMVLPDVSGGGRWRTQSFDLSGFSGHMVFEDKEKALDSAVGLGFTTRDEGALDRVQDLPTFQRGLLAADLIMQVNSGQIRHDEADRKMAQYDERARVLCSLAEKHAQAFVTSNGETIYLLADRIQPGDEQAVFLHEITHRHGRNILGPDGWNRQVRVIKGWGRWPAGSLERQIFAAAAARAQDACAEQPGLFDEELFAYAVEEAVARGVKPRAQSHPDSAPQWLDSVVGALRGILAESLGRPLPNELGPQQTVDLAYALAQLDSPNQVDRILGALSNEERIQMRGLIARGGKPGWFSALERRIESRGSPQMQAKHWHGWLMRQVATGIRPEEIHWSGVLDWLATQESGTPIARARVLGFLRANGVLVNEKIVANGSTIEVERARARALVELTAKGWEPVKSSDGRRVIGFSRRSDGRRFVPIDEDGRVNYISEFALERANEDLNALMQVAGAGNHESASLDASSKYEDYTLSGGSNYREVLLTLAPVLEHQVLLDEFKAACARERLVQRPRELTVEDMEDIDARRATLPELQAQRKAAWRALQVYEEDRSERPTFHSGHWNTPNVIAHMRLTDRVSAEGGRVLFIEEIQSDWAQAGKRAGFKMMPWEMRGLVPGSPEAIAALGSGRAGDMRVEVELGIGAETGDLRLSPETGRELFKPAPFITHTDKWLSLVLKRVVRMAVEEGYDSVAITSGDQQVERYGLEINVESLEFKISEHESHGFLEVYDQAGARVMCEWCTVDNLPSVVG